MMTSLQIAKMLHVLSAFWFVGWVLGRDLTFWRARRETDVRFVHTLLQAKPF
jgi:hypothetical protein